MEDADGVLADVRVGAEDVLEGGGSFDTHGFDRTLPVTVQIKCVVGGGTAPLLLYEMRNITLRSSAARGFHGWTDDWASAVAATMGGAHGVLFDGRRHWRGVASAGMDCAGGEHALFYARGREPASGPLGPQPFGPPGVYQPSAPHSK